MHTLIAKFEIDGQYPVEWWQDGRGRHTVQYGQQRLTFGKYQDLEASAEFGHCVRHCAECAGRLAPLD